MNRLIHYEINENIEKLDIGLDTPLYSVEFYEKEYLIALGKEKALSTKKNTYYFPIYLIHKGVVFKQIGVFEFESLENNEKNKNHTQPFLDKDGDIDIRKLSDPILYPFADKDFFESSTFSVNKSTISHIEDEYIQRHKETNETNEDEDDEDGLFTLPPPNPTTELGKIKKSLLDGIFEHDASIVPPAHLTEESKTDAIDLKKEFQTSGSTQWIENFMRNNQYDIVETATNGDCLFDSIRIAFLQIGQRTTIAKLRAMVAEEADESLFDNYRQLYLDHVMEIDDLKKKMQELKIEQAQIKKRIEKMDAVSRKKEMTETKPRIAEIAEKYKEYSELLHTKNIIDEFDFMKGIETIDQLREHIQKSEYWADEWALSVLERKLNIKLIVFAEDRFETGDLNWILENNSKKSDKVFQCTTTEVKNPQYYIMVSYTGSHYRLISYKTKYIFTFSEVPYDVKIMIVIKCMEKNVGPYSLIASFRHFQTKLGIMPTPIEEIENGNDMSETESALYNADTVFMFYNKSSPTPKPGKGSGEEIPVGKTSMFSNLELKKNKDWRKKLDDSWPAVFTLDQLKWHSVEHYYQGSKFKKMHPEFYRMFSLDAGSDFSENVEMARIAGSKTGKMKDTLLRPQNIKLDSDFYGERHFQEREKAVFAKFSQTKELGEILTSTKDAKLVHYVAKKPAEPDLILMKVRQVLEKQRS